MIITHKEFNQNEIRNLELTINDEYGQSFSPSAAYVKFLKENNDIVVEEKLTNINNNKISILVDTTLTGIVGKYKAIWRIMEGAHTYYHLTEIEVLSL